MARRPAFRRGLLALRDRRGERYLPVRVWQRGRSLRLRRDLRRPRRAARRPVSRLSRPYSAAEIPLEPLGQIVFPEFDADPKGVAVFSRDVEIRRDAIVVVEPFAQL